MGFLEAEQVSGFLDADGILRLRAHRHAQWLGPVISLEFHTRRPGAAEVLLSNLNHLGLFEKHSCDELHGRFEEHSRQSMRTAGGTRTEEEIRTRPSAEGGRQVFIK